MMPDPNPGTGPASTKPEILSDRLRHALTTEAARRALAERDITTVYRCSLRLASVNDRSRS
jgi:hypothetical protein